MGDPDTVKMPVDGLTSKKYAASLRAGITGKATPAADIHPGKRRLTSKAGTPRIFPSSTATATRCRIPIRSTSPTALGLVADGTGVLLNNELDDFTAKPGAANAYGLVGFNSQSAGRRANGPCRR